MFQQEMISAEILLNEFEIPYYRNGCIFTLPGTKMYYRGPELHWKVLGDSFKMSSTRKYYTMIKLKKYTDCYERFLLLRNIPDLLYDMIRFEILPTYLML